MNSAEKLGKLLKENKLTMGTAESCTGGNIAHVITLIPGSSEYFLGGIVSYSNEVKMHLLGVEKATLDSVGAVSEEVVCQMARGAQKIIGCDCTVATSGIAGPGGGTLEKPVGTVWIAAAYKEEIVSKCFHFGENRGENISDATNAALTLLIDMLNDEIS